MPQEFEAIVATRAVNNALGTNYTVEQIEQWDTETVDKVLTSVRVLESYLRMMGK